MTYDLILRGGRVIDPSQKLDAVTDVAFAQGKVAPSDTVVLLLTGHTLKDADYTIDFHRGTLLKPEEVEPLQPEIAALRRNALEVEATPDAVLKALKEVQERWV